MSKLRPPVFVWERSQQSGFLLPYLQSNESKLSAGALGITFILSVIAIIYLTVIKLID